MMKKSVLILEVLREIIFLNADFLDSVGNDVIQFKQTLLSTELLVKSTCCSVFLELTRLVLWEVDKATHK